MDRAMRWLFAATGLLVLALALLLCAQWPLRDLVQAGSRLANDMAQAVFAVYVAVAVTAASRSGTHLAAHPDQAGGQTSPGWRRWALLACVAPWAAFVLWTTLPMAWRSLAQGERFPDSGSPGYFVLKLALCLMALLALLHATAHRPSAP